MPDLLLEIAHQSWLITAQMAPYLLLGFLVAGLLSVFISPVWMERHLGGRGLVPIFKAALFGIPLPLCSCGVLPVGASLRQHGASRAATTAFLLSTPQTGVDSVLVTWTMLGPFFAFFRPLAALVTGLTGGVVVQTLDPDTNQLDSTKISPDNRPHGFIPRLRSALTYGLITLPGDIGRALTIGLVLAGILGAVVSPSALDSYLGQGPMAIFLMMLVGIPLYVCATGSVPIAASFIYLGASPGAALAFLIAGPATNAAALTTIAKILGRRSAVAYLATVAASAFGCGLALDWLLPKATLAMPFLAGPSHLHESVGLWGNLGALVLVLVLGWSWWQRRHQQSCCDGSCSTQPAAIEPITLTIQGMRCSQCAGSVTRILLEQPGVESCDVMLEEGRAEVRGHGLDLEQLVGVVGALGYEVSVVD